MPINSTTQMKYTYFLKDRKVNSKKKFKKENYTQQKINNTNSPISFEETEFVI